MVSADLWLSRIAVLSLGLAAALGTVSLLYLAVLRVDVPPALAGIVTAAVVQLGSYQNARVHPTRKSP